MLKACVRIAREAPESERNCCSHLVDEAFEEGGIQRLVDWFLDESRYSLTPRELRIDNMQLSLSVKLILSPSNDRVIVQAYIVDRDKRYPHMTEQIKRLIKEFGFQPIAVVQK